jgi:hypothetical protein
MKLSEAIKRVDRSPENTSFSNMADFGYALNMYDVASNDNQFSDKVKKHWITRWDSMGRDVGMAVYYMDDEPVAVSHQSFSKGDEELTFVSKEAGEKVRQFIISIKDKRDGDFPLADLNFDIGDDYQLEMAGQVKEGEAYYQGIKVQVPRKVIRGVISNKIDVLLPSGEIACVPVAELSFPLKLKYEASEEQLILIGA